jgi:hypothetical protein
MIKKRRLGLLNVMVQLYHDAPFRTTSTESSRALGRVGEDPRPCSCPIAPLPQYFPSARTLSLAVERLLHTCPKYRRMNDLLCCLCNPSVLEWSGVLPIYTPPYTKKLHKCRVGRFPLNLILILPLNPNHPPPHHQHRPASTVDFFQRKFLQKKKKRATQEAVEFTWRLQSASFPQVLLGVFCLKIDFWSVLHKIFEVLH